MQFIPILLALASSQAIFATPVLPVPSYAIPTDMDTAAVAPVLGSTGNVTVPGSTGNLTVPDPAQPFNPINRKTQFWTTL